MDTGNLFQHLSQLSDFSDSKQLHRRHDVFVRSDGKINSLGGFLMFLIKLYHVPFVLLNNVKRVKACGLFAAAIGVYVVITLVLAMR